MITSTVPPTGNFTHQHPGEQENLESPALEIIIAIDVFFIVATLVGNLVIICAAYVNKLLRTPSILFIISVATAHIAVGMVVLPLFIVDHFPETFLNHDSCKAIAYMTKMTTVGSLAAIVPLSVDAYLRNRGYYNDQRQLTWRASLTQVTVTWLFAAIYAIKHTVLVQFQVVTGVDQDGPWHAKICHIPDDLLHVHKIIVLIDFILLFLAVFVLLLVLQALIMYRIGRGLVPELSAPAERQRQLSTKSSGIFLVVFTICNVGDYILGMYIFWGPGSFRHIHLLMSVFALLGFTMCWVNVVMLITFNKSFRKTLRSLQQSCCKDGQTSAKDDNNTCNNNANHGKQTQKGGQDSCDGTNVITDPCDKSDLHETRV